jgi:hypothetical protein
MTTLAIFRKPIALYTIAKTGNSTPFSYKIEANFNNISPGFEILTIEEKVNGKYVLVDQKYCAQVGTQLIIKRWGPIQANTFKVSGLYLGQQTIVRMLPQRLGS